MDLEPIVLVDEDAAEIKYFLLQIIIFFSRICLI